MTHDADARLRWLVAFHAREESRRKLFRHPRDEWEVGLMRRPVATRRAYALLGALLGTFPPAAIFYQLFGGQLFRASHVWGLLSLTLLMNACCCLAGWRTGAAVGRRVDDAESLTWHRMIVTAAALGAAWGVAAGGLSGLVFFGLGAFVGPVFAVPVGAAGFVLFTALHRLVSRGGMIDARHLWPLAWGVAATITAAILGLG